MKQLQNATNLTYKLETRLKLKDTNTLTYYENWSFMDKKSFKTLDHQTSQEICTAKTIF
jgi:hypothetical protein